MLAREVVAQGVARERLPRRVRGQQRDLAPRSSAARARRPARSTPRRWSVRLLLLDGNLGHVEHGVVVRRGSPGARRPRAARPSLASSSTVPVHARAVARREDVRAAATRARRGPAGRSPARARSEAARGAGAGTRASRAARRRPTSISISYWSGAGTLVVERVDLAPQRLEAGRCRARG